MKSVLIVLGFFLSIVSYGQIDSGNLTATQTPPASLEELVKGYQSIITRLWLNHPDSAMHYVRVALKEVKKSDDVRSQAIMVRLLGGVHLYQGHYDSALLCSERAFELSKQSGDVVLIASAINNIGFTQYHFSNYPRALEYLLRALDMKRKIHQVTSLSQTMNNIGLVYLALKDFDKALFYFEDAYRISDSLSDSNQKLYASNNMGFVYLEQSHLSQAEQCFNRSLEIARQVNNTNWKATTYCGLGHVKLKMGKINEARELLTTSLALRQEILDWKGISEVHYYLSHVEGALLQYDNALYHARLSQSLARQIGARNRELENFDWYKQLFLMTKRFDSALYYQSAFIQLKDSLFNENLARDLARIQMNRQEEKNAAQLSQRDEELKKRSQWITVLAGAAILLVIQGAIYYYHYKRKRRLSLDLLERNHEIRNQNEEIILQRETLLESHRQLEKANIHIDEQNEILRGLNERLLTTVDERTRELEVANRDLKLANLEFDNFIYRSSHDLRGPLVRLLGLCQVALMDVKDGQATSYFHLMNETAIHLNDLFDRLKSVSEINNIDVRRNPKLISFVDLIARIKARLSKVETYPLVRIIEKIDPDISFTSDEVLMEMILYGLLENAVKFQRQPAVDKFVKIRVKRGRKYLIVTVMDNGIGIKESQVEYVFQMFTVAAQEKKNIGLGLYIVKQAVEKLRGSIGLSKSKSGYTRFSVKLPFDFN